MGKSFVSFSIPQPKLPRIDYAALADQERIRWYNQVFRPAMSAAARAVLEEREREREELPPPEKIR